MMSCAPPSARLAARLNDLPFLCDGGLETHLVFHEGIDLPAFASFPLLETAAGRARLERWFARFIRLATERGVGFIVDTVTWRANADWGARLGYDAAALSRINREAVRFARDLVARYATPDAPILVAGIVGPRGDGYRAGRVDVDEAQAYHAPQISTLASAGVDLVCAMTLSTVEEAIGIVRAAAAVDVPSAISFTVETDARLADGTPLPDAIRWTDAATGSSAAYYMINCAHPSHFAPALTSGDDGWRARIRGVRANASTKSHAELDESETLDEGDPSDLAERTRALRAHLPRLSIIGGCCGTGERHIRAICEGVFAPAPLAGRTTPRTASRATLHGDPT
ncbi:homocysteine S-methyltransferase family protein [Salinarimonas chemoclinalis]|uniref:homocysteine S-methyltransferase family protein n=1 Tax=Salinarimonas chemoclinalis TaxID=3241599 RepID=UPI003558FEFC